MSAPADVDVRGALFGQVRTQAMRTLLDAYGMAYPGGHVRIEQQGLDVLSIRADMTEPDGTVAEYEVILTVGVVRRLK